jgi:nitrate/nitrite transport system ATP-binding protein
MAFLEAQGISKAFDTETGRCDVLGRLDLAVEHGEFVAIVGFSGSGKTTLMSILAGLVVPDTGVVRQEGRAIDGPGPERGVVFQNYSLLPWLTVYENVFLAVDQVFADWPAARKKDHALRYIGMVNLRDAVDKRPAQLSGGMRQRVAVARALATDPEVLLMDEPLGALDALTRATLQDEICRIWQRTRKTVVLITNDVDEAILLADRIIPLSKGPGAVLGPSFAVEIDRPRDRKAINHDPRFKEIRTQVIEYLLDSAARKKPPSRGPARQPVGEPAVELGR